MKLGKFIGKGERSKVYAHPTDTSKVIKLTSSKPEIEMLEAFYDEPETYFVTIHELKKEGSTVFAVLDRVENPDFTFTLKGSSVRFFESKFENGNYFDAVIKYGYKKHAEYVAEVKNKVNEVSIVDEYYTLLCTAYNQGCDFFDTAWNLGFLNGKLICFDTTI